MKHDYPTSTVTFLFTDIQGSTRLWQEKPEAMSVAHARYLRSLLHTGLRSLWERWNAFAPEAMRIHELWPSFASECILIDELTAVNTTHWKFAEGTRGAATGFTEAVGFSLISKSKIKKSWREYWVGSSTVLQSLARFAFFSTVGHHTTIGMGQCRPLPPLNSSTRNRLRQVYVHK